MRTHRVLPHEGDSHVMEKLLATFTLNIAFITHSQKFYAPLLYSESTWACATTDPMLALSTGVPSNSL